jgi:predicted nucleotidyltransferase
MNNIIQKILKNREVVEILLKYPEREFTINELSRIAGGSYSSTWRFIKESEESGLVFVKTIGHSNVCRLNKDSSFLKDIRNVLKTKLTPQKAVLESLTREMKRIKGVEKIVLFGSVSRNMEKPGSDVDIALIVKKKDARLEKSATDVVDSILEKSRIKVVPIIMTERETGEKNQFSDEIRKGVVLYERRKGSRSVA